MRCSEKITPNNYRYKEDEMAPKKKSKDKEERLYTYSVSVSFKMQYTFSEKEVQPASDPGQRQTRPEGLNPVTPGTVLIDYLTSTLSFTDCVFPPRVILTAIDQGPDMEKFRVARYRLSFRLAPVL